MILKPGNSRATTLDRLFAVRQAKVGEEGSHVEGKMGLLERLKSGRYRASAVRRLHRERPGTIKTRVIGGERHGTPSSAAAPSCAPTRRASRPPADSPPSDPTSPGSAKSSPSTAATWEIENRLHHVRDVSFDEDRSRVRVTRAPRNLACLSNAAISIVRLRGRFRHPPKPTATTPPATPRRCAKSSTQPSEAPPDPAHLAGAVPLRRERSNSTRKPEEPSGSTLQNRTATQLRTPSAPPRASPITPHHPQRTRIRNRPAPSPALP